LSTAEALRPHASALLFLGSESGPERKLVEDAGLEFVGLPAAPLRRSLGGLLKAGGNAGAGVVRAVNVLRRFRPDVVAVTGGYAAFAAGLAAGVLRIPLVMEEPNAVPGRVTRLLAPMASLITTALPGPERRLPTGQCFQTGFPIRRATTEGSEMAAAERWNLDPDRPVVLVYGGSQGAFTLNQAALAALPQWTKAGIQVLHSAGKKLFDDVKAQAGGWEEHGYRPVPYIEGMADAYALADLVICRGGASSIAEVTACGLPAIIVPYPYHSDRHQYANAKVLEDAGAGVTVENRDAVATLPNLVQYLITDGERRRRMAESSRRLGRPDAADAVARRILDFGF
jgi:UDP-N-acetylglucosamine--N-acetylmuramyl-(pentapeptide) pyrophosphoryl-undecaprenol N-acetylglucosamine transferase